MKRIITILLAITLLLNLSGCNKTTELDKLEEQGYSRTMFVMQDNKWCGLYEKENDAKKYKVDIELSNSQVDEYNKISFDDEQAEQKQNAIIKKTKNIVVTDISNVVPTQTELDKYIGKTLGDLETDGFENTGWIQNEDSYDFYYDGPVYCCKVTLKAGIVISDLDDYSMNDLRKLEIGKVEYTSLSTNVIDFD